MGFSGGNERPISRYLAGSWSWMLPKSAAHLVVGFGWKDEVIVLLKDPCIETLFGNQPRDLGGEL
jgi:hypothetical protein